MARDTSKDVTHQQTMSKLSEKSKQTSASLLNSTKVAPKALADSGDMDGVLGKIYQLMVDNRQDELAQRVIDEKNSKTDAGKEEQRHQELLKALTIRRRPKPKRVIRREKKAEEKEAAKPTEPPKPTAPGKKPPEAAKKEAEDKAKKAAEDKAKKEAEDKAKKESQAAKDKADKEAKAAKDRAEKESQAAKEKADKEAKQAAEKVKKEEVKKKETATEVKPPEVKPPPKAEAAPAAPKPAEVKPPPSLEKITTGVAVATTAALMGKETLAANIAKYESRGSSGKSFGGNEYNAYNKGTVGDKIIPADKPIDFSKMTISEFLRRGSLNPGDPDRLFAIGRYQIIPNTMKNLITKLKIDPDKTTLDPGIQDLLFSKGLTTSVQGRAAVDDYINGKPGATKDAAILALAKEFASVGVPYDTERVIPAHKNKKGEMVPEQRISIKKGQSFYSGLGGNKAHNPPEEVGAALDADRASKLKNKTTTVPPTTDTGAKVDQSSKENADLKEKLNKDKSSQTTNNTTTTNNQTNNVQPQQRVDDRPPHIRKQQQ